MLRIKFALISLSAAAVASAGVTGPQGIWMLTDGDSATDAMIQGGSVQTFAQAGNTQLQYAIAWSPTYMSGTFMTIGRDVNGVGGVYDLNHNQVDSFTNFSTIEGEHLDGTMDGAGITYAANFTTGDIVKFGDGLFNGPVSSIYNAGANNIWTITYHGGRDTLFIGQANGTVTEVDLAGNVLNSFVTPDGTIRSLAYDGSDGTMWYLTNDGSQIVQIDGLGSELGRATVNLGGNYWGGEIAPVPEPATIAALGLGLAALLIRRKK